MSRPKPIRVDLDTWFVMRNDKVIPKACIERRRTPKGDVYQVIAWDLDPSKRVLRAVVDSLEKADDLVLYDNRRPPDGRDGPPNGIR